MVMLRKVHGKLVTTGKIQGTVDRRRYCGFLISFLSARFIAYLARKRIPSIA